MPKKSADRSKLSSQQLRDLQTEIGFMEGVVRRDPEYIEALQILGDDYTKGGRFSDGLVVDERLASLRPADPTIQYNLACSYSLTKSYPRAIAALERAIDLGYTDFNWLSRDPDLRGLRRTAEYKRLRAKITALKAARAR